MPMGRQYQMAFIIGGKVASSFDRMTGRARGGIQSLQKVSRALTIGLGAVATGMGLAVRQAAKYETGMARISTMLDAQGKEHLPEISEQIDRLSRAYGLGAETIQEGAFQALSASVPFDQLAGFMETAARSAVGGTTDIATAVDGLSNVVNAFGLDVSQAGEVSDAFFTANRLGKVTFEQLAQGLGEVNSLAGGMGAEFRDVTAYLAAVTKRGVLFEPAVTSLSTALAALADPTAEAAAEAQRLGIAFGPQAIRQMGGFLPWLEDLQRKTGGSIEVLAKLFGGKRGLKGMAPALTAAGFQDIASALEQMKRGGSHLAAFGDMSKTAAFRFAQMKQELWSVVRAIGAAALPAVTESLKALSKELFGTNRQLSEAQKKAIAQGVRDTAAALKIAVVWTRKLWTVADGLATALGGWDVVLKVAAGALLALKATEAAVWVYSLSGAVMALNAALLANPIVLFIGLFVAWVAAIVIAIKYWDQLSAAIGQLPGWLKVIGSLLAYITLPLWALPALIVLIARNWDTIVDAVTSAASAVGDFFVAVGSWIASMAMKTWALMKWLWQSIKTGGMVALATLGDLWDSWGTRVVGIVRWVAARALELMAAPMRMGLQLASMLPESVAPDVVRVASELQGDLDRGISAVEGPSLQESSQALSGQLAQREQARQVSAPLSVDYRPQITLSGSEANRAGVDAAIRRGNDDLLERLAAAQEQQQRVAFGG